MKMINLEGIDHKHTTGDILILQPVGRELKIGAVTVSENLMTGTWFVMGQKGEHSPYTVGNEHAAVALGLTVDYWNKTGERKKFTRGSFKVTWRKE